MDLYSLKGNNLTSLEQKPFKKEKEIQDLVEKNTKELFGVQFVSSEFTIDEFRIDTLCFDDESKSFVIIEYKKGSSYSVIDQGYSYLSKMLNNKDSFVLEYCKKKKVSVDVEIDWSQSRIIFVSPSFNSYQKNSVNFQDIPFELWEIKRFSNDSIVLNQHLSQSNQSIKKVVTGNNNVIDKVSKEIKVHTKDDFLNGMDQNLVDVINELEEKLSSWNDISFRYKKKYLSIWKNKKVVVYLNPYKKHFLVEIVSGVNWEGKINEVKKLFKLNDSRKIFTLFTDKYRKIYRHKLLNTDDLDYFIILIKQKYDSM